MIMSCFLLGWEVGFREAPGRKNGWGVRSRQLPQRSAFQDLASEKGRVSVLNEKNIREASSQELSKSRAQTTPSFCSIFVASGC